MNKHRWQERSRTLTRSAWTIGVGIGLALTASPAIAAIELHGASSPMVVPHDGLMPAVRNPTPSVPDDSPPPVTPPSGNSDEDAFVRDVLARTDGQPHGQHTGLAAEHTALLSLVPRSAASHIAVSDGNWSDPATWYRRQVPDQHARVLIPEEVDVDYDLVANEELFTARVGGQLRFATTSDTRMVVDTLVVAPTGRLEIGTAANPVRPGVSAEVLIASNGDIDTTWDPTLLSRGLISHGAAEIHGSAKVPFLRVAAAPMAGSQTVQLDGNPDGWRTGDRIVLTGTKQLGWYWDNDVRAGIYHESQDEERTIAQISGTTITLDRPLAFDHATPRSDLAAYVANTSRSVTVSSMGGSSLPVHQRGHVMFMHSDDVDVRYAAFDDLGRTDKSQPAADASFFDTITATTNVKGRYSVHFHRTGTQRQDDPAIAIGNSVSRSPGWGYAHHSSHANFTDNVAFDVFGAAFAAEDGDETGSWVRNIAIKSEGIGWGDWTVKEAADVARHDNGRTGDGFFFAGRLVEAAENVAANTTHGFVWLHRGPRTDPSAANLQHRETAYGATDMNVDDAAIEGFRDNEAFATHIGIIVVKANPAQGHDVRSVFDGFLNWETVQGVNLSYTAHYTLLDLDLLGLADREPFQNRRAALHVGTNASDITVNGITGERFTTGLEFISNTTTFASAGERGHVAIDAEFVDVDEVLTEAVVGSVAMLDSSDLTDQTTTFEMTGSTTIGLGDSLFLDGTKTDSIGTTNRHIETDRHEVRFWPALAELLVDQGYWELADGTKVMLVHDVISDRATGAVEKVTHVVELDATDSALQNAWWFTQVGPATFNGEITLGGPAPTARSDSFSTPSFETHVVDVTSNDDDPDGGAVYLAGTTDPTHGDLVELDDGTLTYRSDFGYVGIDGFDYWIIDDEGNLARSTVMVDVTGARAAAPLGLAQSASASTAMAPSDSATIVFVCEPLTVLSP